MSCSCRLIVCVETTIFGPGGGASPLAFRWTPFGLQLGRRQNRRHQIGKALADARARLGHQMPLRRDRPRDRLGHLQLLRPLLVVLQPRRDAALRAKNIARRRASCRQRSRVRTE